MVQQIDAIGMNDVLAFWFGEARAQKAWFKKSAAFDQKIRRRFFDVIVRAQMGQLHAWDDTAAGKVALIIVLDQFSRNVARGQAAAFAGDPQALALAQKLVASGQDKALPMWQRAFVYMPFEHAEDLGLQERAVALFSKLCDEAKEDTRMEAQMMLQFAQKHRDVIARFGRFPGRNMALGRANTPAEMAFLKEPNAGF